MKKGFYIAKLILLGTILCISNSTYALKLNPDKILVKNNCFKSCDKKECSDIKKASVCLSNTQCADSLKKECKNTITKKVQIPTTLNTSNKGKQEEFKRLFKNDNLQYTNFDVKEIDSTALNVVVHKASNMNEGKGEVIIEDTSLEVEGADVGVNIRWLLENLPQYEGKKATWKVLLAFRKENIVFISEGVVKGEIVKKSGDKGFGFDPYFMPKGKQKTLADDKPDLVNARAIAVKNLMNREFIAILPAIDDVSWQAQGGKYQHD